MRYSAVTSAFILFVALGVGVSASNVDIKKFSLGQGLVGQVFGIFSKEESPEPKNRHPDAPSLNFDLSFELGANQDRSLEIIAFHSDARSSIGKTFSGRFEICCYDALYERGDCPELGRVIFDKDMSGFAADSKFWHWTVVDPNQTLSSSQLSASVQFKHSGIHRLAIIHCAKVEKSDNSDIIIDGKVVWLNPYGHLPGTLYALMPAYLLLACLYFIIGCVWAFLSLRYRKDLQYLQLWIGGVIAAAFLENLIFGIDYAVYNNTGNISLAFNIFSVLLATITRTASYIALLQCTIGATIIMPSLERKHKLMLGLLGVAYFVFTFLYRFVEMLRYTPQTESLGVSEAAVVILLIPSLLLDFLFLFWIFTSLFNSLMFLLKKKQAVKLQLFKRLGLALFVVYIGSFIFFIIQVIALFGDMYDKWWKGWWIFLAYWNFIHIILVVVVGFLWRPNTNNARYAYSDQLLSDPPGEEEMGQIEDNRE